MLGIKKSSSLELQKYKEHIISPYHLEYMEMTFSFILFLGNLAYWFVKNVTG